MTKNRVTGGAVPIVGMHHVGVQVADLERSLAFYRDLLGFEEVLRTTRDDPSVGAITGHPGAVVDVAHLRPPSSAVLLELTEYRGVERRAVDTATANPGTAHTCYVVQDLDAVHAALVARGVRTVSPHVVAPPAGPMRGGRVVYVQDPDGVRVELVQLPPAVMPDPGR